MMVSPLIFSLYVHIYIIQINYKMIFIFKRQEIEKFSTIKYVYLNFLEFFFFRFSRRHFYAIFVAKKKRGCMFW